VTLAYNITGNEDGTKTITVYPKGETPLVAHSTHPYFDRIVEGALADDVSVADLFDLSLRVGTKLTQLTERIASAHGLLYFDGEPMDDELSGTVLRFIAEGVDDWKPLALFFENVMQNPNEHSREHLYRWLKSEAFTLTDDGMIVGYKSVHSKCDGTYQSDVSGRAVVDGEVVDGKIPNNPGTVVSMPRNEVTFDPTVGCSVGLHVGTYAYALGYHGNVVMEVKVNPRDVVSVPTESSDQKMRVCRYEVVGVVEEKYTTSVKPKAETKKKSLKILKTKVKKGQVYEDTDKRRGGRQVTVVKVDRQNEVATVEPMYDPLGRFKQSKIALSRLQSRKYRLVR
jgi:hypothetical protein